MDETPQEMPAPRPLPPRPPARLKLGRAWTEDSSVSSAPPDGGDSGLLSPPTHPMRTALPGESASAQGTPEPSNVDSLQDTIETALERPKSPSVSSVSSKRTSLSVDFNQQIRQRIRQKAKTLVQKKRGSVQLAKRLLRSQTLTLTQPPDSEVLEDQEGLDQKIEASIQAGSHFLSAQPAGAVAEQEQRRFLGLSRTKSKTDLEAEGEKESERSPATVFYQRSVPNTQKSQDRFRQLLTTYGRKSLEHVAIQDPLAKFTSPLFSNHPQRDLSVFCQRHGTSPTSLEAMFTRLNTLLADKPLRFDHELDEEETVPMDYQKAVNWDEWDVHAKRTPEYCQLDLDLNRVEFDHHWLFTEEDLLLRSLTSLHHELCVLGGRLVDTAQRFLLEGSLMETRVLTESQKGQVFAHQVEIAADMQTDLAKYHAVATQLDKVWERVQAVRGPATNESDGGTRVELRRQVVPLGSLDPESLPERLRDLAQVPVYSLEHFQPPPTPSQSAPAVRKLRLQVLIFFNDILVCSTTPVPLLADFSAEFRKVFPMRVYETPESVMLVLRESQGTRGWVELARVYLPIPEDLEDARELTQVQFASDLVVHRTSNSLGCGLATPASPCLSGRVLCRLLWSTAAGLPFLPLQRPTSAPARPSHFELIPRELRLASEEEWASDFRLEALAKRFAGGSVFRETAPRWIGLASHEVDAFWLAEEGRPEDAEGATFSMDAVRRVSNKHAALVRSNLVETFARGRRLKTLQDVVKEDALPSGFTGFGDFFGPADLSRKLKPMRTQPARTQVTTAGLKLVVNVQSATHLPHRLDKSSMHVFVECNFQEHSARTNVVSGKSANWQETLVLNLAVRADSLPDLRTLVEHVELDLYDERSHRLPHDSREPDTVVHRQLERRWLGRVSVPFSTILSLGKIDGVLALKQPLFLSDYRATGGRPMLKVMITMDPAVAPPSFSSHDHFQKGESETVNSECRQFEVRNRQLFPARRFVSLVTDGSGKRILPCRYLRPLRPPPHVEDLWGPAANALGAVGLATHLVSCIPTVADPIMFPGVCDVWTSAEQLLSIGAGDEEEHAVLLCCWLLHMRLSAVLVLGRALPEGVKAAFVLVHFPDGQSVLANATDGNVYSLGDTQCPLISIGSIVTPNNVYANIQKQEHPSAMDFDLKDKSNWNPLFSTSRDDLTSVQPAELTYTAVNEDLLVELRSNLEREIRLKFDESRSFAIPQWNLMASRALRELLAELDDAGSEHVDVQQRLAPLTQSYRVSAVAFRSPYVSRACMLLEVLKTNVHLNADRTAQFALSVHIQPFVNNIVSCSVAIASLVPLA